VPSDFAHPEETFASAFSILREAIEQRVFPSASIALTYSGKLLALKSFGRFAYAEDAPDFGRSGHFDVDVTTLFDLASLTKPIATTTMAMILYERGLLELDAPIAGTVPEFLTDDSRRLEITFPPTRSCSSNSTPATRCCRRHVRLR
jgi:CubicO group peptidase (beta-lactamase class C family)